MGRSVKKGPHVAPKLLRRVLEQKDSNDYAPIRTWSRACTILPEFVSHTFLVHNGKSFERVFVREEMVGHKLGEFAPTRIFRGHTNRRDAAR